MDLDELYGNLDNALHYLLPFLLTVLPFILTMEQTQINVAAFTSSSVTSLPGTLPALLIALKSAGEGKYLFKQIPCLISTGNLPLAE
jgi:hypothetical protein